MSDTDLVDIGDRLVVKIAENVVGYAEVVGIDERGVMVQVNGGFTGAAWFILPADFKANEILDGYGHFSQPIDGQYSIVEF